MSKPGWTKCPMGCGISHREGDPAPIHDATWASDALRAVIAAAAERGFAVLLSEDLAVAVGEVVN